MHRNTYPWVFLFIFIIIANIVVVFIPENTLKENLSYS